MSDVTASAYAFDGDRRPPSWLWLVGAIVALLLHLGCIALAVMQFDSSDDDNALGAPALEIGLELAAPRAEATDLPPGPDSEASAASQAMPEQKSQVEQTELPKDQVQETEEPDRLVTQNDAKKPVEDEPKVQQVQTQASAESVASEATAMPTSETAVEAPRSTAPAQGTGDSNRLMRVTWQKTLMAHLDRHKRYPTDRARQSAEILVSFEIDRTGRVLSTRIAKSSGDSSFDEAALAMMKRADPLPPPPPLVADEGLSFTLPVVFRVRGKK